jgi:hypothetical protein
MTAMRQCLLVVLSVLILLGCDARSFGQNNVGELLDQKLTVRVSNATLIYVLARLALDHRIRLGLEKSHTHKDEAKINIEIEGGTLREVLDSIVRQEPAYQWQMVDGVINFTPTHDRYEFVATLLNTPVSRFAPAKGIDTFEIRNCILELPEVRSLMASSGLGVDRLSDEPYPRSIYGDDKVDLSISNTNVRGVLNKVIRDSEYKTWVVEMSGNNKDKLIISF